MQRNNIDGAPAALGPYCHSTTAMGMTFVSGQLGLNPATNVLREGVEAQVKQAMENIRTILEGQGLTMNDISRCTIYYVHQEDFPAINAAYGAAFEKDQYPARVCVQVAGLPAGGLIMIDAIALENHGPKQFIQKEIMMKSLVQAASFVLSPVAINTPCVPFEMALSKDLHAWLKLENLQITGSFKLRGAYFMMSKLIEKGCSRGVTACSAGNHAQGVAFAAKKFGAHANIFIPETAPSEKIEHTRRLGAEVTIVPGGFEDAKAACEQYAAETGAVFIPPYDNYFIIAGQSTIAVEVLEALPETTAIIVPVGGGGLISGIAFVAKQIKPDIRIYGVQSEAAPGMVESIKAGHPVTVPVRSTLADGIHVARPGDITFKFARNFVDDFVTVSEEQISEAMRMLMMEERIVVEGASCV
ncbi:MAG: pyridoxal-phosphate dependent enzyme, partial [Bacteroidaceae bacterium]|nr:pyridoxal-phosphate dependent enzyme [Bacteroidaceae bacterium]